MTKRKEPVVKLDDAKAEKPGSAKPSAQPP